MSLLEHIDLYRRAKHKKKFRTIRCSQNSFQRLHELSLILNAKKSAFLDELLNQLYLVFSDYAKGNGNIMYTQSRHQLIINSYGKCNSIVGSIPDVDINISDEKADQLVREEIEREGFEGEKNE